MRVIAKPALSAFYTRHAAAKAPLLAWYGIVMRSDFENFAALRDAFNSVDKVGDTYIFNIGGNNYRLIAAIHFNHQKLFVREILTHAEYDKR